MSLHQETPTEVDGNTRKTRTIMDQLKAAMHTATDPAVRAEIRDEMGLCRYVVACPPNGN